MATSWSGGGPGRQARWPACRRRGAASDATPQAEQIAELQADKQRLEQELVKARFVVDVQAKLHALLETISEGTEPDAEVDEVTDAAITELAPIIEVRESVRAGGCGAGPATGGTASRRHRCGRSRSRTETGISRGR